MVGSGQVLTGAPPGLNWFYTGAPHFFLSSFHCNFSIFNFFQDLNFFRELNFFKNRTLTFSGTLTFPKWNLNINRSSLEGLQLMTYKISGGSSLDFENFGRLPFELRNFLGAPVQNFKILGGLQSGLRIFWGAPVWT